MAEPTPGETYARDRDDGGYVAIGCITGLVALGAIIFASLVALWADNPTPVAPAPAPAPVVAAPAPEPAPAPLEVPEGAGVTASERAGKPLLTTYFESGKTDVVADFETAAATMLTYLEANPEASVAISGFNDPTGNAEINARLSKERAENVQAALVALGVAEERTDLVKPDDTTSEEMSNAEARRVEVTIAE
ncbi:MAG: OmpA family protein [Pseudomonadota bacterium]